MHADAREYLIVPGVQDRRIKGRLLVSLLCLSAWADYFIRPYALRAGRDIVHVDVSRIFTVFIQDARWKIV